MSGCRQDVFETVMPDLLDPADLVRRFYNLRRTGDPEKLRALIREDVVWREPEIGGHMGELLGVDAVLDMIRRAQRTTGGSFSLDIDEIIATGSDCAAVIRWQADKGEQRIEGRELAVFRIDGGLICKACFFPENLENDHAFWA